LDFIGLGESRQLRLGRVLGASRNTGLVEPDVNIGLAATVARANLGDSFTGRVEIDTVLSARKSDFSGQVYNLSTAPEWFACNSIITHNCRHTINLYLPGITTIPDRQTPVEGSVAERIYKERLRQRYLERGIRQWKRREASALSPDDLRLARSKIKEWRGALKEHISSVNAERDGTGIPLTPRLRAREQIIR
jgi:hypothetical protein